LPKGNRTCTRAQKKRAQKKQGKKTKKDTHVLKWRPSIKKGNAMYVMFPKRETDMPTFFDGYCSTVQGLLDWVEVDLGFTELSFIQIDLCVLVRETDMHTDPPKKTYARVEKTSVHKQRNMQCQGEKYMHKNQKK